MTMTGILISLTDFLRNNECKVPDQIAAQAVRMGFLPGRPVAALLRAHVEQPIKYPRSNHRLPLRTLHNNRLSGRHSTIPSYRHGECALW